MNALAYVLDQAARVWPEINRPVEPGFAEKPQPRPTPSFLREATPYPWFRCSCHGEQS